MLEVAVFSLLYFLFVSLSPFPLWRNYWKLWGHVLFDYSVTLGFRARFRQALYLAHFLLLAPICGIFFLLDEIFFRDYRATSLSAVVIIFGQPRSGTTYLHRLIAEDSQNFAAVRHFEWRWPFISALKLFRLCHLDRLLENVNYWPKNLAGQRASLMHADRLGDWEEEGIFLEERMLSHYFVYRRFPYPRLLASLHAYNKLSESARAKMCREYRRVLRKIIYLKKPHIGYVGKENESMRFYMQLVIPELVAIGITRPSRDSLSSYVALSRTSTEAKLGVDPIHLQHWHKNNVWKRRQECRLMQRYFLRRQGAAAQTVLLHYELLMTDPESTLLALYARFAWQMPKNLLGRFNGSRAQPYFYEIIREPGFEEYDRFVTECANYHRDLLAEFALSRGFQLRGHNLRKTSLKATNSDSVPMKFA